MTEFEKVEALRVLLDEGDEPEEDAVLLTFLRIAGEKIIEKAFPFRSDTHEVPAKYGMTQVEIAAYLMQKRGAEGETYHSENGINRSYEAATVPPSMLAGVIPFSGVVG